MTQEVSEKEVNKAREEQKTYAAASSPSSLLPSRYPLRLRCIQASGREENEMIIGGKRRITSEGKERRRLRGREKSYLMEGKEENK